MKDLIDVVGIREVLDAAGVKSDGGDFEALYSALRTTPGRHRLVRELENRVFDYFDSLRLPDGPTLYHHLVLSLRPKDIIATFNWDPLLFQALRRCSGLADPPLLLHLHGCTAIGYCSHGRRINWGERSARCPRCKQTFRPSPILYPISEKNYSRNPLIQKAWSILRRALRQAYMVTVFGYSAPRTDVEARMILSRGWGAPGKRNLEEFEFIDLRPSDELAAEWKGFICETHYRWSRRFFDSTLGKFPRRSCEAIIDQVMDLHFPEPHPIPRKFGWWRLEAWLEPLLVAEVQARKEALHARPATIAIRGVSDRETRSAD